MKNKKFFLTYIFPLIIILILLISLTILGSIKRIGYLNSITLIKENTYSFRISYYDKVFKNSDIYDVYLNIEKIIKDNDFIKEIQIGKKGNPFGTIITTRPIYIDKIYNIQYSLKLKKNVYLYAFITLLFLMLLFYRFLIIKKNNIIFIYSFLLVIIQIFIYFSLYNYFRTI